MNCHPETFDQLIPDKERLRYALIDIDNLRRCLMQAYKEAEMWKNRVELCPSQGEIAQLKADLAATRALLREASGWLGDNDAEESLIRRINAALAGEKK